jgi:hypothetical protein
MLHWLCYSLRFIILFANVDVSRHILVIDTFVLAKSNMGRREYWSWYIHCAVFFQVVLFLLFFHLILVVWKLAGNSGSISHICFYFIRGELSLVLCADSWLELVFSLGFWIRRWYYHLWSFKQEHKTAMGISLIVCQWICQYWFFHLGSWHVYRTYAYFPETFATIMVFDRVSMNLPMLILSSWFLACVQNLGILSWDLCYYHGLSLM